MSQYIVEQLIDTKQIDGQKYILVKWKDYPVNQSTWEPLKNLKKFKKEIQELEDKQKLVKSSTHLKKQVYKKLTPINSKKIKKNKQPIQIDDSVQSSDDEEYNSEDQEQNIEEEEEDEEQQSSQKSEESECNVPQGSYKNKDKPSQILKIKTNDDIYFLKVKWKRRRNGVTPLNSWITNIELKKNDPLMLIDFYESKIRKI